MRLRLYLRKLRLWIDDSLRAVVLSLSVLVVSGAGVLFCTQTVWPAVQAHPYFKLRSVRVTCDQPSVSPQAIARQAGLVGDTTLWQLDIDEARRALHEVSWVRDAQITRQFPGQVTVRVHAREAVAATLDGGQPYLVDAGGVVFRAPGAAHYPDLPYLTGWNADISQGERLTRLRTLLELASRAERAGYRVSQVHVDERGEYWLLPETPRVSVRLGARPDPGVLDRLDLALVQLDSAVGATRLIDVSSSKRVLVKAVGGELAPLLAAMTVDAAQGDAEGADRG